MGFQLQGHPCSCPSDVCWMLDLWAEVSHYAMLRTKLDVLGDVGSKQLHSAATCCSRRSRSLAFLAQSSSRTTALLGPSWMAKCWTPAGSTGFSCSLSSLLLFVCVEIRLQVEFLEFKFRLDGPGT